MAFPKEFNTEKLGRKINNCCIKYFDSFAAMF